MATITHPTGNGYCRDRVLRDMTDSTLFLYGVYGETMDYLW